MGFDGKAFCESSGTWILWGFSVAETVLFENLAGCFCPSRARRQARPGSKTIALKTAIFEPRITLESVDDLDGALGTSSGGCIRLLNSLSPATEFTTLVHESAHELLHRADDRPASRDTRELEAEAVAFVVGGAVGLNTSDASRDYIHLYRGDRAALAQSLTRVQQTAATILRAIDGDASPSSPG